jgi:hypothetical protein
MISFSTTIVLDRIDSVLSQIERAHDDMLRESGEVGLQHARANSRVKTGYMKSRNQLIKDGILQYSLINDAPYSGFINFGHHRYPGDHFFDHATQRMIEHYWKLARTFESRIK